MVPLFAFVMVSFVIPIFALMWQGVYNDRFSTYTPNLTQQLSKWDGLEEPDEALFMALVEDLKQARKDRTIGRIATRVNQEYPGTRSLFTSTARKAKKLKAPFKKSVIKTNKKWANIEVWRAMKITSQDLTPSFYATALDGRYTVEKGFVKQNENRQIYVKLFWRTFVISATVMGLCLLLGYPVAYLLATLPLRSSNLLMIMVLLPFWTSLLVRTTAWIAILQSQGVINDLMVAVGITADESKVFSYLQYDGHDYSDDTHLAALYDSPTLFCNEDYSTVLYAGCTFAWRNANNGLYQGVCSTNYSGCRCGRAFGLYSGNRLLYYTSACWWTGWSIDFKYDRVSYAKIAKLVFGSCLGRDLLAGVLLLYWIYDRVIGIDNMKLG